MYKSILIATSIALPIALASSPVLSAPASKVDRKYHKAKFDPKIIGGSPAVKNDAPWQASLQGSEGGHFCGGSLIDKDWVLTAAHCVEDQSPQALRVRIGITDLNGDGGETRKISGIAIHPGYAQGESTDIALLKLASPVTNIKPVSLADNTVMEQSGSAGVNAMVSGWGNMSTTGDDFPNKLMKVEVPLVSNQVCNSAEAYGGQVASTELCAGLAQGGKDSCQGDSGGPLVIKHNNAWVQAGVVSWGDGCAVANKYGVYARVSSFNDWISKAKQGDTGATTSPGNGTGTSPTNPEVGVLLIEQVSGSQGSEQIFKVEVGEEARMLWVDTLGGNGDVDVFIAYDREPSAVDFDYMQANDGNSEYEFIPMPEQGTYYIMLHGYTDFSDTQLTVLSR